MKRIIKRLLALFIASIPMIACVVFACYGNFEQGGPLAIASILCGIVAIPAFALQAICACSLIDELLD